MFRSKNVVRCLVSAMLLVIAELSIPIKGMDKAVNAADSSDVRIIYKNLRHAYLRGEEAVLSFTVFNDAPETIERAELTLDIDGIITRKAKLGTIGKCSNTERLFRSNQDGRRTGGNRPDRLVQRRYHSPGSASSDRTPCFGRES